MPPDKPDRPDAGRRAQRRVTVFLLPLLASLLLTAGCVRSAERQSVLVDGTRNGQWPAYGGTPQSTRYSPLALIDRDNVHRLEVAWFWETVDRPLLDEHDRLRTLGLQATPLMIDGVLYTSTSLSQVAAIDAGSGETLWVFDPETWKAGRPTNWGFVHRGVAYWSDGRERRLFLGTGHGELISIDADDGRVDRRFGEGGRVSIRDGLPRLANPRQVGLSSPPVVFADIVMVGSSIGDGASRTSMPPGQVRAYDVRTGERRWTFDAIADAPEGSWQRDSAESAGNTNVWAPMSVDPVLGRVYLPLSTPTNDFYGGHRPGDNRFGESLVCLDATSGELLWHFQIVHHGLWDYDLPAAPILVDLEVMGEPVAAVVQLTKQGFAFVFDRVTGEPVWPIEERPVAASDVPGEESWPTQPFPTRPPPFERQGVSREDLNDLTPELLQEAEQIAARYVMGPLYTPPTVRRESDVPGAAVSLGTLQLPGSSGGANWGGGAFDPETGWLYVPSITSAIGVGLRPPDPTRSDFRFVGRKERLEGPQGLPLVKPPWGRISALDLGAGTIAFQVPNGRGPVDHPAIAHLGLEALGQVGRAGPLLTANLLFVADGTSQTNTAGRWGGGRMLRAHDKTTGEVLAEIELPAEASGVPMTYLHEGRQTVVVAVSGPDLPHGLVALRVNP